jgi:hypothetical protein
MAALSHGPTSLRVNPRIQAEVNPPLSPGKFGAVAGRNPGADRR